MKLKRTGIYQWHRFPWLLCTICAFLFLSMLLFLNSCALSRFGQADVTPFKIEVPKGLVGLSKSGIIDRLGLPEGAIADEEGNEYWAYNNANQYFIFLFGQGGQKSLVLKIEKNIVTSVRLIEKGASSHILTGGM